MQPGEAGDDRALPAVGASSSSTTLPQSSASAPAPAQLAHSTSAPEVAHARRSRDGNRTHTLPRSLTRRTSAQQRVNNILEAGRQRAETLRAGQPPPAPGSPTFRMEPLLGDASPRTRPTRYDTSEDEGLTVRRNSGRHISYNSISPDGGAGPRARRSVASGRRDSPAATQPPAGHGTQDDPAGADGRATETDEESVQDEKRWWTTVLANFQSIELDNKGSVARDHLALERTFLAWLRTSLAFASIGVAITQLFRLNTSLPDPNGGGKSHLNTLRHVGKPLGATFLSISILILFLGYNRYYRSQQWILRGKFPASRGTILIVSTLAFGLMLVSLVVVVVVQPGSKGG